eukprot:TRINITY_DN2482_c0_g1_i2.p1 TRINITY_DN2482_c0_g1~~TRINITY_DN2482_c0_g1_i2.p1  ORF type:complete len:258 (-),score=57.96 TRINITY_DN2482_c0_g1_i2:41-814(-)
MPSRSSTGTLPSSPKINKKEAKEKRKQKSVETSPDSKLKGSNPLKKSSSKRRRLFSKGTPKKSLSGEINSSSNIDSTNRPKKELKLLNDMNRSSTLKQKQAKQFDVDQRHSYQDDESTSSILSSKPKLIHQQPKIFRRASSLGELPKATVISPIHSPIISSEKLLESPPEQLKVVEGMRLENELESFMRQISRSPPLLSELIDNNRGSRSTTPSNTSPITPTSFSGNFTSTSPILTVDKDEELEQLISKYVNLETCN